MKKAHQHIHRHKHRVLVSKKQSRYYLVDRLTYAAAIIEPIITIPQAMIIFREKTAAGISLSSWVGFQILTAIWIWYAIVHKERLILIYQGLFFIIQAAVIVGAVMYGASWW